MGADFGRRAGIGTARILEGRLGPGKTIERLRRAGCTFASRTKCPSRGPTSRRTSHPRKSAPPSQPEPSPVSKCQGQGNRAPSERWVGRTRLASARTVEERHVRPARETRFEPWSIGTLRSSRGPFGDAHYVCGSEQGITPLLWRRERVRPSSGYHSGQMPSEQLFRRLLRSLSPPFPHTSFLQGAYCRCRG